MNFPHSYMSEMEIFDPDMASTVVRKWALIALYHYNRCQMYLLRGLFMARVEKEERSRGKSSKSNHSKSL